MKQREQRQAQRQSAWKRFAYLWLLLLLFIIAACGEQKPAGHTAPHPAPTTTAAPLQGKTPDALALDMLNNIKANGFNGKPSINNGLGGLWINWRYGTKPLQTNLNGSGFADDPKQDPPRHDKLTDLRYVHALWLYKSLHKQDHQFDKDLARYTAIVKHEFTDIKNERGWLYDLFVDLYQLSGDRFYQLAANSLASYFYNTLYHQDTGIAFLTNSEHPHGYYRADLALEQGCALIQAGKTFNMSEWEDAGRRLVQTVYKTAYLSQYHLLLYQLDNVLLPGGAINPNPRIYRGV
ncbi:MAG: hypothetical protein J2P36_27765, partial [Ktedonobacteraceae bacterium]|nr:hypothetical protein [Ktedonobacteraceae bacterium]